MKNKFKVPVKKWRKWSEQARGIFNATYSTILGSQWAFLHPKTKEVPKARWETTAWNTAWIAADAANVKPNPALTIVSKHITVKTKRGYVQRPVKKR